MNIILCVKEIPDPEMPASVFRLDPESNRAILPEGRQLVISDYDERAVEAALKIKDSLDSKITVLSLGRESAKNVIRHCLAMGCDEGILLSSPSFDDSDSFATAFVLAEAIKKRGEFDLILCGREEGEWGEGQVGSGIAELLGIPSVTMVANIEIRNGKAVMERVVGDGREIVEVSFPALATVSSEIGEPRYPSFRRIREASRKEIPIWNHQGIALPKPRNQMLSLFIPSHGETKCEFIEGSPEEKASRLALVLREAKLI